MVTSTLECATCGYASPDGTPTCPGCARPRRTRPLVAEPPIRRPVTADDLARARPLSPTTQPTVTVAPATPHGYRSLLPLARLTRTLLAVTSWVAAGLAAALAARLALRIDAVATAAGTRADWVDVAATALMWAVAGATAVALISFVAWSVRAHRNLPALGIRSGQLPTTLAALGWILPGANLVVPKLVVDDLWRASSPSVAPFPGPTWRRRPVGDLVHRWWALWLAVPSVLVLGSVGAARQIGDVEPGLLVGIAELTAASGLVAAALAGYALVAVITVAQARRSEVVALDLHREQEVAWELDQLW
jgi:hypothetical protein